MIGTDKIYFCENIFAIKKRNEILKAGSGYRSGMGTLLRA